jgi:hypothetical protein
VQTLRLPLSDLRSAQTRRRFDTLAALGIRIVLFTAELPDARDRELLEAWRERILALEWVAPRHRLAEPPEQLPVPLWLSVHPRSAVRDGLRFDHFPLPGFLPEDPELDGLPPGLLPVLRLPDSLCPARASLGLRRPGVLLVELPRAGEARAFTDDLALAQRVVAAAAVALGSPGRHVLLDGFVDHDRGYFPRHGLLDRKGDPRPAWWALRNLSRLCRPASALSVDEDPRGLLLRLSGSPAILLPSQPCEEGIDLVTGLASGPPSLHPRVLP